MGEMGVCPVCRNPFAQSINEIPFMKKKSTTLTKEQKQRRQKILEVTRKSTAVTGLMRNQAILKLCPPMDSEVVVATRCGHVFHKSCLRNYCESFRSLKSKGLVECPICHDRIVVTSAVVLDLRALEGYSEVTEQKLKFAKVMNKELKDQYEPLLQKIENMKQETTQEERMLVELERQANKIREDWCHKKNEYNDIIAKIGQVKELDGNETKLQMENRRLTSVYLKQLTHDLTCTPNQRVPKDLYPYLTDIQMHPEVIDFFREIICPLPVAGNRNPPPRSALIRSIINTVRKSKPSDHKLKELPEEVRNEEPILQCKTVDHDHSPLRRQQPKYRPEGRALFRSLSPTSASSLDSESTIVPISYQTSRIDQFRPASPIPLRQLSPSTSDHADEECDWEPLNIYHRKKTRRSSYSRKPKFNRPARHGDSSEKNVRFRSPPSLQQAEYLPSRSERNSSESVDINPQKSSSLDIWNNLYEEGYRFALDYSKNLSDTEGDTVNDRDRHGENTSSFVNSENSEICFLPDKSEAETSNINLRTATSEESLETIKPVRKHRQSRITEHRRIVQHREKSRSRSSDRCRSRDRAIMETVSANAILMKPNLQYPKLKNMSQIPPRALVRGSLKQNIVKSQSKQALERHLPKPQNQASLRESTRIRQLPNPHGRMRIPNQPSLRENTKARQLPSSHGTMRIQNQPNLHENRIIQNRQTLHKNESEQRVCRMPFSKMNPELQPVISDNSFRSLGFSVDAIKPPTHQRIQNSMPNVPSLPSLTGLDIPTASDLALRPRQSLPYSSLKAETSEIFNTLISSKSSTDLMKALENEFLSKSLIRIENRLSQYKGLEERVSTISIVPAPRGSDIFQQYVEVSTPNPGNSIRQQIEMIERTLASLQCRSIEPPPEFRSVAKIPKPKPPTHRRMRLRSITPPFRKIMHAPPVSEYDTPSQAIMRPPRKVLMRVPPPPPAICADSGHILRPENRSRALLSFPNLPVRDIRTPLGSTPRPASSTMRMAALPKYARIRTVMKPSEVPKLPVIDSSPGNRSSQINSDTRYRKTSFDPYPSNQRFHRIRLSNVNPGNHPPRPMTPKALIGLRLADICLKLPPGQLGEFMNL